MTTRGHYFHKECVFCARPRVTGIAGYSLCAVHLAKVEAIKAATVPERERERPRVHVA